VNAIMAALQRKKKLYTEKSIELWYSWVESELNGKSSLFVPKRRMVEMKR